MALTRAGRNHFHSELRFLQYLPHSLPPPRQCPFPQHCTGSLSCCLATRCQGLDLQPSAGSPLAMQRCPRLLCAVPLPPESLLSHPGTEGSVCLCRDPPASRPARELGLTPDQPSPAVFLPGSRKWLTRLARNAEALQRRDEKVAANGTREGKPEERSTQYAVLAIVPVFCVMGLLGILFCNLLMKKGYHCTAQKEVDEEGAKSERNGEDGAWLGQGGGCLRGRGKALAWAPFQCPAPELLHGEGSA